MMLEASAARNGQNWFAPHLGAASEAADASILLCRAGAIFVALPIEHVVETMRVLPLARVEGVPAYVLGLSVIHGTPTPVVDIGLIVNGAKNHAARLVTVRMGAKIVALAVDEVVGITAFAADAFAMLPPLLQDAATETIAGVGAVDTELLVLLRTSRLVPEDVLARLNAEKAVS
jgi:purine-binding chemotaxis protein CheW